ncbi:MAG: hypothetical protein KDD89_04335 [Anaerolineales bacterium]|nr:hypothetical protein [Anaerolineales bacterium]
MKFFDNLPQLLDDNSLVDNEQVWRGADGSYAVGNTFPADAEEGETDYIEAGTVGEYRNSL